MIYLCKPGGVVMGALSGIDEKGATLQQSIESTWMLSFDIYRYINVDGELVQTDYYEGVSEMMELLLIGEENIRFQIDSEPTVTGDGKTEKKTVQAHSIEVELGTKYLKQFKINCGTKDSQEYLLGEYDSDDNFINLNLNPYTNLPIDYIVVKNDYADRLREVKNYLSGQNLQVSSANGLVQNYSLYEYLKQVYEEFPRLSCDTSYANGEITCDIYMTIVDGNNRYGYEIYLGCRNGIFNQSYLIDGLTHLIEYYEEYGDQLSLIDLALQKGQAAGWTVGEIPDDIKKKKFNFTIDSQDILSFFKQKCTQAMKVLFDFDRYNRKVNIIDVATMNTEYDTGVFLTFRNLVNTVNIRSSSADGIRTKIVPKGNEDLGILYVNFGENSIINLDYLMDKVNEYGELQYVNEEIRQKYHDWVDYRENQECSYIVNGGRMQFTDRRDAYRELSRMYNQKMIEIDEFKNRLPNDACNIDFTTFPFKDLNIAYKAYMNALEALEQMYMADVGAVSFKRDTQYAVDANGNEVTNIHDTFYGLDFNCYYYTIIPNVMRALMIYVDTKGKDYLDPDDPDQYDPETGDWIEHEGGNPIYNENPKIVTESMVDVWLYDMSLYGIVELETKQKAWRNVAGVIYKPGYVLKNGMVVDPIPAEGYTYNTADEAGWNRLNDDQKSKFTNKDSFIKSLNEYLDYVDPNVRENKLTKDNTKGVIAMAQDKIDELQPELDRMLMIQEGIQTVRKRIADQVLLENWTFTDKELELIYTLIKESDYTNQNILITNLDTIATTVDAQEALYQDALIELSERSQPQLSFNITLDNLYELEEFACFRDHVKLLRFIRLSVGLHDDDFVKLRVVGIKTNPCVKSEVCELQFSNMTYSLQGYNDLAALFDNINGSSSSGGGGGSGSSHGTYGDNDAEITIANNMLSALLRSKPYTKSVSDTVISNLSNDGITKIIMASSGIFDKLQTGDMVISGDCITDHIKSSNYDEDTKVGSYLALKDGTFTYADGKLTWDGRKLYIDGDVEIGSKTGNEIIHDITEKSANFSGDYTPTESNSPANQWTTGSQKKEHENDTFYDTSTGITYIWKRSSDGVLITFSPECATEYNYDYVRIYYQDSDGNYLVTDKLMGGRSGSVNTLASARIFVPASTFYLYWYTDSSVNDAYGYKIESVEYVTSGSTNFNFNSSLPMSITGTRTLSNLPESPHNPYTNGVQQLYKINTGYNVDGTSDYRWVKIQDQEIYSKIAQTSESISLMVKKNEVISMINQSPESIQISASKVAITGFVTFSNLSTSGETTINGNNITTGIIKSTDTYTETDSSKRPTGWSGNTTPVSWLEMNTGRFSFGKGGLYYGDKDGDGVNDLNITGNIYGTDWSITKYQGFVFSNANKLVYNKIPVAGEDVTDLAYYSQAVSWSNQKIIRYPTYTFISLIFRVDNKITKHETLAHGLPTNTSGVSQLYTTYKYSISTLSYTTTVVKISLTANSGSEDPDEDFYSSLVAEADIAKSTDHYVHVNLIYMCRTN